MKTLSACMGVAVSYDPKARFISDSRGIGRWKKIVVGPSFLRFPDRERQAILLHEVAHCKLRHVEARIASLWLLFWRPAALRQLCIDQEHAADAFVRAHGFGLDLARAFSRLTAEEHSFHPPMPERIARLTGNF